MYTFKGGERESKLGTRLYTRGIEKFCSMHFQKKKKNVDVQTLKYWLESQAEDFTATPCDVGVHWTVLTV